MADHPPTDRPPDTVVPAAPRAGLLRHAAAFAAMLLALELAQRQGADWFRWTATTAFNPALQEGWAWRHGRLDIGYWLFDTAYVPDTGRVYNVYPPLQSMLGFLLSLPFDTEGPMPQYGLAAFALFALPMPIAGYWAFHRRTGRPVWAAVLTLGWLGGTAVMPCYAAARADGFHHVNHLLSQVGLLVLAAEALGRRRAAVMLAGLAVAAWTRQLSIFYAPALLLAAWAGPPADALVPGRRPVRRWLPGMCAGLVLVAAVPMGLSWAKFGSPLRSGYERIYEGRANRAAENARAHGLFSAHFVPVNAYYMNTAAPWARDEDGRLRWRPSGDGASLWLGTPLAALALIGVRGWGRDRVAAALMLCSAPILVAHLLYHNTGYQQHGYYRFALDYLPVWLVVAAPWLATGWRRWATAGCVAWSLAYFAMVRHWAAPGAI